MRSGEVKDGGGRLHVCYVSGLDLRQLSPERTPFLSDWSARGAFAEVRTLPSNELFPTLVTGVDPTEHGVWGVKLRPEARRRARGPGVFDGFRVTLGCIRHAVTGRYDLPAIPPHRRERFDITRTKYKRRRSRPEALYRIGDVPSVFDVVGRERTRYVFSATPRPAERLLPKLCADVELEFLEYYALDRFQQWKLDDVRATHAAYAELDRFLAALYGRCLERGMRLLVVSDHGHEPITRHVDLEPILASTGLFPSRATHFVEVSSARFWAHDDPASRRLEDALRAVENARLVRWDAMKEFGVPLRDSAFGEWFLFLDPGAIFFPHDFYQPLANLGLGLSDRRQWPRIFDPRHRGNHGYLPDVPTERAFVMLCDESGVASGPPPDLLDVAPTILGCLGRPRPAHMTGRALFA